VLPAKDAERLHQPVLDSELSDCRGLAPGQDQTIWMA
jgi:hypothetical protein